MTEKLPVIKCSCACGFKHYNSIPCKIQNLEIPLSTSVLGGTTDLIVQVFLVESPAENDPQMVEHYVSQFSAIQMQQKKQTIYNSLNDSTGNLSTTSLIRWTVQDTPSASVERYRLHVANLPPFFNTELEAKLTVQFWRVGTVNGKSKTQKLSKHCPEVISFEKNQLQII